MKCLGDSSCCHLLWGSKSLEILYPSSPVSRLRSWPPREISLHQLLPPHSPDIIMLVAERWSGLEWKRDTGPRTWRNAAVDISTREEPSISTLVIAIVITRRINIWISIYVRAPIPVYQPRPASTSVPGLAHVYSVYLLSMGRLDTFTRSVVSVQYNCTLRDTTPPPFLKRGACTWVLVLLTLGSTRGSLYLARALGYLIGFPLL